MILQVVKLTTVPLSPLSQPLIHINADQQYGFVRNRSRQSLPGELNNRFHSLLFRQRPIVKKILRSAFLDE